jgi:hypothetical protein
MVHPKQTVVTPEQITATHLYRQNEDGGPGPAGGYEIFIGTRSIGFVTTWHAHNPSVVLVPILVFLGIPEAQACNPEFRKSIIDDRLPVTLAEIEQISETWMWGDRLRRGELAEYEGVAAR